MKPDQNGNSSGSNSVAPSWGTKAGYIGTGVLVGLVIYPFVRKAISKLQPKMDKIFDDLTGKAENLAEKASDLLARAKEGLRSSETESDKHRHSHEHVEGETTGTHQ